MKNYIKFIFNFMLAFIFYSCSSDIIIKESNNEKTIFYSNYQIEFFSNGNIKSVGRIEDSLMLGQWTYFFDNGIVKATGKFNNGNWEDIAEKSNIPTNGRNGKWIFYTEDGFMDGEYNYLEGKRNGILKEWYSNSQLKGLWNYIGGKKEGIQRMWYESGKTMYEGNYTNGKLDGLQRTWYESGSLKEYGNFKNGEIIGEQIKYNEDGSILDKFVP